MPVYEYECKACHREFEYQQRMADPNKTVCEACGGALERLISRTAFQLKGGGWYKDLYSSSKPGSESTKSAETAKPGESTSAADKGGADKGGADKGGADKGASSEGGGGTTGSSDKPKSSAAAGAS